MIAAPNFRDLVVLPENLIWAWRKARSLYQASDALHDQSQVASFELDLDAQLARITREVKAGSFQTSPIYLLPQPKRPDADGKPRMRQSFQISVRDQVAWIALINVIGPTLDQLMPSWSYGHRLYRTAWYEEIEAQQPRLNIGPYRHTTANLYRKFKHSWPLFRRHVSLTARKMATGSISLEDLDEGDKQALEHAEKLSRLTDRLSYLENGFWSPSDEIKVGSKLYYASFDLEKFYPKVRPSAVLKALDQFLPGFADDIEFRSLVSRLLHFDVRMNGLSESMGAAVDPPTSSGRFEGLPTGLMVAGFLANVALLPVDAEVERQIQQERSFAQFRFVDDHSVLAFSFETLIKRIRVYRDLLLKHEVGPSIAPDKYDPKVIAKVVDESLSEQEAASINYSEIRLECELDGRRPNKLLTRTLAQVSLLATADFDTLTDDAKLQRLEQLEWLLLANIPEREVRTDTRAAFAAGRIAALAPTLFHTSAELVDALRSQKRNVGPELATDQTSMGFPVAVEVYSAADEKRWKAHCAHYFSLLFQAFGEHPDKVRLLIRLLEYGKGTGYDVFSKLGEWMEENSTGANYLLKRYLSALTLHAVSKLVVLAADDLTRTDLLQRQIKASREFIDSIVRCKIGSFVDESGILSQQAEFFQVDALRSFCVGLRAAAVLLRGHGDSRDRELDELADRFLSLTWNTPSSTWLRLTKCPIGVWVHWAQALSTIKSNEPSALWQASVAAHDATNRLDWNNLRRFPAYLPVQGWDTLSQNPRLLADDDAGWLLEAARGNPSSFASITTEARPFRQVKKVLAAELRDFVTLVRWAAFTKSLDGNDPRAGEWSALEITRQIVEPMLEAFGNIEALDIVHPESVLVPASWLNSAPDGKQSEKNWTWQNWIQQVRQRPKVKVASTRLSDFRIHPSHVREESRGFARVRGLAQILWGLIRRDFSFPSVWNIRGEERAVANLVRYELEHLRISSMTLAILEATLTSRSRETVLFPLFPSLFGNVEANDTLLDPPLIRTINDFDHALMSAQRVLQERQVTVLNHQPRQLIPANIGQLAKSAFSVADEDDDL